MCQQVKTCLSGLATPLTHQTHSPHQHSSLSSVHHHLSFRSGDSSSTDSSPLHVRTKHSLPVEQQLVQHHTDDSFQDVTSEEEVEHFPTVPLDLDGRTSPRQALMHP